MQDIWNNIERKLSMIIGALNLLVNISISLCTKLISKIIKKYYKNIRVAAEEQ